MQCKWLQIFCLCAAIQFQLIVGNPNGRTDKDERPTWETSPVVNKTESRSSNASDGTGSQSTTETLHNGNYSSTNNGDFNNNNGQEQGNLNRQDEKSGTTVIYPQDNETSTYSPNYSQKPEGHLSQNNETSTYSGNRDPRVLPRAHICTKSTEYYDCQIRNVHLKYGQSYTFGLEHNPERKLTFRDSTLEYLPKSLIDAFPYVTLLNLNNLMIGSIEPSAFKKAANLETLYLEENRLTNIDRGTFSGAAKLQMLVLSKNEISSVDRNIFESNRDLQYVYLDQNQLNKLPAFTNTAYLKYLNASHNNLASIGDGHFSNLRNLRTLDVSFNRLERLNLEQVNANLDHVDVSFNELTYFNMPPHVTRLNARNNSLPEFVVGQHCALTEIDLSWNKLETQPAFETCRSLERLDLSYNLLEVFRYQLPSMNNLQRLNLAHNNLFEIHLPIKTNPWLSLKALDLSKNKLSYGPPLGAFQNLEGVFLNDNHLISLKSYANAAKFRGYRMANNEWSCNEIQKFQHLTHDKNSEKCNEEMQLVDGICCRAYNKPYNDRLNQILREADFHERQIQKNCPKPMSTANNHKNNMNEIHRAIANANSVNAAKLKEIQDARNLANGWEQKLNTLKTTRDRLNSSKHKVAQEIEKQRQFYRVTKEGLIPDKEMLERIMKFVQEKDVFNRGLLSRREQDTEESNKLFGEKQQDAQQLKNDISYQQKTLSDLKQQEKIKRKEKEQLEKMANKNAASIHGGSGRISQ